MKLPPPIRSGSGESSILPSRLSLCQAWDEKEFTQLQDKCTARSAPRDPHHVLSASTSLRAATPFLLPCLGFLSPDRASSAAPSSLVSTKGVSLRPTCGPPRSPCAQLQGLEKGHGKGGGGCRHFPYLLSQISQKEGAHKAGGAPGSNPSGCQGISTSYSVGRKRDSQPSTSCTSLLRPSSPGACSPRVRISGSLTGARTLQNLPAALSWRCDESLKQGSGKASSLHPFTASTCFKGVGHRLPIWQANTFTLKAATFSWDHPPTLPLVLTVALACHLLASCCHCSCPKCRAEFLHPQTASWHPWKKLIIQHSLAHDGVYTFRYPRQRVSLGPLLLLTLLEHNSNVTEMSNCMVCTVPTLPIE